MSNIVIPPEEMRSAASQLDGKATEINQILQQVKSQIESLSSVWQGQAANNFASLMVEWGRDVQGINDVLSQVSQHLRQSADIYEQADIDVGRGFQMR